MKNRKKKKKLFLSLRFCILNLIGNFKSKILYNLGKLIICFSWEKKTNNNLKLFNLFFLSYFCKKWPMYASTHLDGIMEIEWKQANFNYLIVLNKEKRHGFSDFIISKTFSFSDRGAPLIAGPCAGAHSAHPFRRLCHHPRKQKQN